MVGVLFLERIPRRIMWEKGIRYAGKYWNLNNKLRAPFNVWFTPIRRPSTSWRTVANLHSMQPPSLLQIRCIIFEIKYFYFHARIIRFAAAIDSIFHESFTTYLPKCTILYSVSLYRWRIQIQNMKISIFLYFFCHYYIENQILKEE